MRAGKRRGIFTSGCFLFLFVFFANLGARIAIYGDTQYSAEIHAQVAAAMAVHKPGIAFHTGDLSSHGSKQKNYDGFFSLSAPLLSQCQVFPARGNHDSSIELFLANFPQVGDKTWYSVKYDSLLCIVLDSNQDLKPRSVQYDWLCEALADTSCAAKIVILHHPIFSSGSHGGNADLALFLPSLFARSGVVAVFSGHDHDYERLQHNGVTYFVNGGGGGLLREKSNPDPRSVVFAKSYNYLILDRAGKTLTCTAYTPKGEVLDSCDLALP